MKFSPYLLISLLGALTTCALIAYALWRHKQHSPSLDIDPQSAERALYWHRCTHCGDARPMQTVTPVACSKHPEARVTVGDTPLTLEAISKPTDEEVANRLLSYRDQDKELAGNVAASDVQALLRAEQAHGSANFSVEQMASLTEVRRQIQAALRELQRPDAHELSGQVYFDLRKNDHPEEAA